MPAFKSVILVLLLPVCFRAHVIEPITKSNSSAKNEVPKFTTNDIPWLVSVQVYDWHSCVGSIIAPKFILTTASCIL